MRFYYKAIIVGAVLFGSGYLITREVFYLGSLGLWGIFFSIVEIINYIEDGRNIEKRKWRKNK